MTTKKTATKKKASRKKAPTKRKVGPKAGSRKKAAAKPAPPAKDDQWETRDGEGEGDSPTGEPTAKEGAGSSRGSKEAKAKTSAPRRAKGAPTTLQELSEAFVEHLKTQGKTESTVWGYGMELKSAARELGANTKLTTITVDAVARFYACDRVTKKRDGTEKAMPGVSKTRRVLRLALVWAVEKGWLAEAPVPDLKPSKSSAAK